MQSHVPLYTTWERCGDFYFVIQEELYFFVCQIMKNFAVIVREGVDTVQDIFEQRNHGLTEVLQKHSRGGVGGWVLISNDHTDKCCHLGCGFQTSLV